MKKGQLRPQLFSQFSSAEVELTFDTHLAAYRLVRGTLDEVRRLHLKVVPQCWFVREVMQRRAEFQDLLR